MDLSKLSDSDLQQIAKGDLRMVSEQGLKMMAGESSQTESSVEKTTGGLRYSVLDTLKDAGMGALKGATDIGATLLRPVDAALNATGMTDITNAQRRASLGQFFQENSDPESLAFQGGALGSQIAGTAGMGGVLAKGLKAIPVVANAAPKLVNAIESGGFNIGSPAAKTLTGKVADMATRIAGGAITGAATAGSINPSDAGTGAVIGGAIPAVAKAAGEAGKVILGKVSPEVSALYQKAKSLGIDIPSDRIANSKPLNAMAASLNYVPLSGRAAKEKSILSQFNRAISRTFGQDSDNVTMALRKAGNELGGQFDDVLSKTTVKVDSQFIDDLAQHEQTVLNELDPLQARVIQNQINAIINKSRNGLIDGQAAYNIKKTLDRIGNRGSNEAYYAREVKKSLMGALNRSLPADEAQAFTTLRQQYGNMLDLEGLAQNGAEGGISVGRLANMKGINNPEMQDLADIAAQFLVAREAPHGAAQRVTLGMMGLGASGAAPAALPFIAGGMAAGRSANMALNSQWMKNMVLTQKPGLLGEMAESPLLRSGLLATQASPAFQR